MHLNTEYSVYKKRKQLLFFSGEKEEEKLSKANLSRQKREV